MAKKKRRSLKELIEADYERYQKRDRHAGIRRYFSLKQLTVACFSIAALCVVLGLGIAAYMMSQGFYEGSGG